jgi:hypothetical protein
MSVHQREMIKQLRAELAELKQYKPTQVYALLRRNDALLRKLKDTPLTEYELRLNELDKVYRGLARRHLLNVHIAEWFEYRSTLKAQESVWKQEIRQRTPPPQESEGQSKGK